MQRYVNLTQCYVHSVLYVLFLFIFLPHPLKDTVAGQVSTLS